MNATPDIRWARHTDLPDLLAMITALSAFHDDTATISQSQLQKAVFGPNPTCAILIATRQTKPVGYAGLVTSFVIHSNETRLDIHHLFVQPQSRRRGVATALIKTTRDHAHHIGATRLTIGTIPNNATAIATYRAMCGLSEITTQGPQFTITLDD